MKFCPQSLAPGSAETRLVLGDHAVRDGDPGLEDTHLGALLIDRLDVDTRVRLPNVLLPTIGADLDEHLYLTLAHLAVDGVPGDRTGIGGVGDDGAHLGVGCVDVAVDCLLKGAKVRVIVDGDTYVQNVLTLTIISKIQFFIIK